MIRPAHRNCLCFFSLFANGAKCNPKCRLISTKTHAVDTRWSVLPILAPPKFRKAKTFPETSTELTIQHSIAANSAILITADVVLVGVYFPLKRDWYQRKFKMVWTINKVNSAIPSHSCNPSYRCSCIRATKSDTLQCQWWVWQPVYISFLSPPYSAQSVIKVEHSVISRIGEIIRTRSGKDKEIVPW